MAKNSPHFYIVTPSYNQGHFLEQTIQSIFTQSYIGFTLVVIDGGSKDDSVNILKKYSKDKRLKWTSEKDVGQSDALNKGIRVIEKLQPKDTDIFAYLNSDDYYLPGAFKTVVQLFQQTPMTPWLIGDSVIVDAQGNEIQAPIRLYKKIWRKILSSSLLSILNPIPQPSTFIRWDALHKTGNFNQDLHYTMDYEYWHRLFRKVGKPHCTDQALAAFRIHGQSKGGSQFMKQFAEELEVAGRFTTNTALLFLHKLHNLMITGIYSFLK